jgi:hypothetical protein
MTSKYTPFYNKLINYFDDKEKYISSKIKLDLELEHEFLTNSSNDKIIVLKHNSEKILKARYIPIGMYNINTSIWYWSWNIDFVSKSTILKSYAETIKTFVDKNSSLFSNPELEEYDFYSSNGNFFINHTNVPKLIMYAMFLNKAVWFFPIKTKISDSIDGIEYVLIDKIYQF